MANQTGGGPTPHRRSRARGMGPDLLSLDMVAKVFRVSKRTIYNWRTRGDVPKFHVIGGANYMALVDIRKVLGDFVVNEMLKQWTYSEQELTYVQRSYLQAGQ